MLFKTIKLTVSVCVAVACGAGATAALAASVPGATYKGRTAGGAYVVFTVSADGRKVSSYEITGVVGDTVRVLWRRVTTQLSGGADQKQRVLVWVRWSGVQLRGQVPRSAVGERDLPFSQ